MAVKIMQLDYDTGKLIDTYKSIKIAAHDNRIAYTHLADSLREGFGVAVFESKKLVFAKAYSVLSY